MPLPSPRGKQDRNSFINSCVSSNIMVKEFPNQKQRLGVCFSQWHAAKKKKRSQSSTEEPKWEEVEKEKVLFLE